VPEGGRTFSCDSLGKTFSRSTRGRGKSCPWVRSSSRDQGRDEVREAGHGSSSLSALNAQSTQGQGYSSAANWGPTAQAPSVVAAWEDAGDPDWVIGPMGRLLLSPGAED